MSGSVQSIFDETSQFIQLLHDTKYNWIKFTNDLYWSGNYRDSGPCVAIEECGLSAIFATYIQIESHECSASWAPVGKSPHWRAIKSDLNCLHLALLVHLYNTASNQALAALECMALITIYQ